MISLDELGPRICILGRSNGGKSTLADAIGNKLDVPVTHLDLIYHQPDGDWIPRRYDLFEADHDAAIAEENWVVEGNYSALLPKRLKRATGAILIDTPMLTNLFRYVRRTLFESGGAGRLAHNEEQLKWVMFRQITVVNPKRTRDQAETLKVLAGPVLHLKSMDEINQLYEAWHLERRVPRRR